MAEIIWTDPAAEDLAEIAEYIARDKPDAAANFVGKLLNSVDQLADFPLKGRVIPEFESERYRELVVFPCRVIYTPTVDAVVILRIIQGERQLRQQMFSPN